MDKVTEALCQAHRQGFDVIVESLRKAAHHGAFYACPFCGTPMRLAYNERGAEHYECVQASHRATLSVGLGE